MNSIPCKDCDFIYISETGWFLSTTLSQHKGKETLMYLLLQNTFNMAYLGMLSLSQTEIQTVSEALHIRRRGDRLMNRDVFLEVLHM